MQVPLTITDFLERAETVFADREAVVDEPDPPGGGLGTHHLRGPRRRRPGRSRWRSTSWASSAGERVAICRPNAARFLIALLRRPRLRPGARARSTSGSTATRSRYIVEHSGASVLLVDPEYDELVADIPVAAPLRARRRHRRRAVRRARARRSSAADDEDATATINYTSGTTARPKGVQMTHRNLWLNAVTFGWHMGVTDRDVYLHTLPMFHCNGWGLPFAVTGDGRAAGRDPQDRRRGHPRPRRARGRHVPRRRARGGGRDRSTPRPRGASAARRSPGRGTVRMVVAGAPPPSKIIERVEAELGWEFMQIYGLTETSPLLTVNRAPRRVRRPRRAERARRLSRAGVPADRRAHPGRRARARCSPAPTTCSRATGSSRRRRPRRSSTAGSTPATAATSTARTS